MNRDDLRYFQSMPLDIKVAMTRTRIREWVTYYGESGTYVSFSGGKDSTVLLHLVREIYPDIPAVFVNTGLEYPEIQSFAKSFPNVKVIYPKKQFNDVLTIYGYPFISKEISQIIYEGRKYDAETGKYQYRIDALNGNRIDNGTKSAYNHEKYKPLLYTDFVISNMCCDVMKKGPAKCYEHEHDRKPFIATLAEESNVRASTWYREGCNAFESKRPTSKPMSFWTENDVLQYIKDNNLKIARVYGEIVPEQDQLMLDGFNDCCKLKTTGCSRTGCIFCGFGAHLDEYSRFKRLKQTHPKQYAYCIGGGGYDIDGLWKPNAKGLGMGHVIDTLNELYSKGGKAFIEY